PDGRLLEGRRGRELHVVVALEARGRGPAADWRRQRDLIENLERARVDGDENGIKARARAFEEGIRPLLRAPRRPVLYGSPEPRAIKPVASHWYSPDPELHGPHRSNSSLPSIDMFALIALWELVSPARRR